MLNRPYLRRIGVASLVAALGYLVLAPLLQLQSRAFKDGAAGYQRAFDDPGIGRTIRYTIGLAAGSLAIALVLGTGLAWAATRLPRRLRLLRIVPIFPIVVPAIANVVGWAFLFSPRPGFLNTALRNLPWWRDLFEGPVDIYSIEWIVILTGFGLTSFVYLFVSAGLSNISAELIEAAQVSGSSSVGVFFRVVLPLLRPTLLYGGGVALLLGLGQFTGPLLLGRNSGVSVVTTEMYRYMLQTPIEFEAAAAIGSPLLVLGIVVVLVQKLLLTDQRRFVTHGGKAFRPQNRPSKLAAAVLVLYSLIATVAPVTALVLVSLTRFWSGEIIPSTFTLHNFREIFGQEAVKNAIYNSISISLFSMLIVTVIGFVVASILLRNRTNPILRTILDVVVAMPLGVPAVVFGTGFLLAYTRAPLVLYGTRWVMVVVYVTLMLPFATRMQVSGMLALGDGYIEAARVSGAGPIRTNLAIVLPLMRGALGGAAALMFVLMTHEFTASVLVRSPRTQVMGTVLFDAWGNGGYPQVAAIALVMSAVTAVGVLVALVVGGASVFDNL